GRERSPQLVAHVGYKLVLVLACDFEIFYGLGKLAGACLHLFEQPRVFNRDYGLVRKGIDEVDLTFVEWAHFAAPNEDRPNCLARVDQWHGERGAKTELERNLPALGIFIRFGQDVCDLNRPPVEDGTPCNAPTPKGE